jgi:hypothetical protein
MVGGLGRCENIFCEPDWLGVPDFFQDNMISWTVGIRTKLVRDLNQLGKAHTENELLELNQSANSPNEI